MRNIVMNKQLLKSFLWNFTFSFSVKLSEQIMDLVE